MPILRALSTRSTPATAAQLERVAGAGTGAGIRRALERLADHGVCVREEAGGRSVYSLNYEHVLYPAVIELLKADRALGLGLNTYDGHVTYGPVAEAHAMTSMTLAEVLS